MGGQDGEKIASQGLQVHDPVHELRRRISRNDFNPSVPGEQVGCVWASILFWQDCGRIDTLLDNGWSVLARQPHCSSDDKVWLIVGKVPIELSEYRPVRFRKVWMRTHMAIPCMLELRGYPTILRNANNDHVIIVLR